VTASAAFAQTRPGLSDFGLSASTPITVRDAMPEDGFGRVVAAKRALESNLSTYVPGHTGGARWDRDSFERAATPAGAAYDATVSSGSGIEWPQIGVGFVVGILLALCLGLALRHMRVRPLVH